MYDSRDKRVRCMYCTSSIMFPLNINSALSANTDLQSQCHDWFFTPL